MYSTMPTNWKLTLAYDGTDFHGWQVQPGAPTIQGTLADAIARITGETVLPQGSGRTDAGVHAFEQVASFQLTAPIPEINFLRALNCALPPSISVLTARHAPPDFHARHSAIGKTYQYRVLHRNFRNQNAPNDAFGPLNAPNLPFIARYVYTWPWPLDLAAMQQAAKLVLGEHDFASFAASDPDLTTRKAAPGAALRDTVRAISESAWTQDTAENLTENAPFLLRYTVSGNGFLHHMVRNLVGTFLEIGRGQYPPETVSAILAARNRAQAGPTAPACGLFLLRVAYPDAISETFA